MFFGNLITRTGGNIIRIGIEMKIGIRVWNRDHIGIRIATTLAIAIGIGIRIGIIITIMIRVKIYE